MTNPFSKPAAESMGNEDECPEFYRASGDCLCPVCQKPYRKHPWHPCTGYDGEPFLRQLCNGDVVKL